MTPGQCRAARGLLNWTQKDLALAAGVSPASIKRHELGICRPLMPHNVNRIRSTLERHGVEFAADSGVTLKQIT